MAAWLTKRSLALSRRQSAGIMSPADSRITSPGTRRWMGSSARPPASSGDARAGALPASGRSTVAVLLTMALSASAAWLDFSSCQKRSRVDSSTMLAMTTVAFMSSVQ